MKTKFVEASSPQGNWGKFMLARFDSEEMHRPSGVQPPYTLLASCGWGSGTDYLQVTDLQTGEGVIFRPGGSAEADLRKHAVWVCPLFEPFLDWLYASFNRMIGGDGASPAFWDVWFAGLPAEMELDVPLQFAGHRRPNELLKEELLAEAERIEGLLDRALEGDWSVAARLLVNSIKGAVR